MSARLVVEVGQESAGRWRGEVPRIPGIRAYGRSRAEAINQARAMALRAIADRVERGEQVPEVGVWIPEVGADSESEHLAALGAELAGAVWEPEDFTDWEGKPHGENGQG